MRYVAIQSDLPKTMYQAPLGHVTHVDLLKHKESPSMSPSRILFSLLLLSGIANSWAAEGLRLPAILSEHAVLQRSAATKIWGKGARGDSLSIHLGASQANTTVGADGTWSTTLDLLQAPATPMSMEIVGKTSITVPDILVGEVWLCSGQSNMAFALNGSLDGPTAAAAAVDQPTLRFFRVPESIAATPRYSGEGRWEVCSPASASTFSGIGFWFGSTLQRSQNCPIGMICAAFPSSTVTSWTSANGLVDAERDQRELYLGLTYRHPGHADRLQNWLRENRRLDHLATPPVTPSADAARWVSVKLPGPISGTGLPSNGALWLRHEVSITPAQAGRSLQLGLDELHLGRVYWNDTLIDEVTPDSLRLAVPWEPRWTIRIPGDLIKAGSSVLSFRLYVPAGAPALRFDANKQPILSGTWQATGEYALPALSPAAQNSYPGLPPLKEFQDLFTPSTLFDAMINPLRHTTLAGVAWYQGEANAWKASEYESAFVRWIGDWRSHFGTNLPILFCQLPNNGIKKTEPEESKWAVLREAQAHVLDLPHTGMAVLIDTADADLHPRNKKEPGERLARLALAKVYSQEIPAIAPSFSSAERKGQRITLRFTNSEGGLVAKPLPETWVRRYRTTDPASAERLPLALPSPESEIQGFAICGADKQWKWAQARIEHTDHGDLVEVWRDDIPQPMSIRYAWADNPTCNLYGSKSDLPVVPFRADIP